MQPLEKMVQVIMFLRYRFLSRGRAHRLNDAKYYPYLKYETIPGIFWNSCESLGCSRRSSGPSVVVRNKFYRPYISLNLGQFSMKMELGKQLEPNLNMRVRELQRRNGGGGGWKSMKFPELCRLPPFTL